MPVKNDFAQVFSNVETTHPTVYEIWLTFFLFSDAIAAFMDGLVSQPETQPVVQSAQDFSQAQYGAQAPAPAAPAAPFYNPVGWMYDKQIKKTL